MDLALDLDPAGPLLADGAAGLALAHAVLEQVAPGQGHAARSRELLVQTVALLGETELSPGLWDGVAGVGWALSRLSEPGEDPAEDIDALLVELAQTWPEEEALDWISGLAGLACYAAARAPRPAATALFEAVAQVLHERAEPVPGGVAWNTTPLWYASGGRGRYDLGLAHGQPGLLVALSLAVEAGISAAEPLWEAGLGGLFGLIGDADPMPRWVGGHEAPSGPHAWCYGPAGVGAALARMGRRLGRAELERRGYDMACNALLQPVVAGAASGLCHGPVSALAMARAVGHPEATSRWTAEARALPAPEDPGLLNGRAGVALALSPGAVGWLPLFGL